jgi:hypothetical protein
MNPPLYDVALYDFAPLLFRTTIISPLYDFAPILIIGLYLNT